MEFKGRDPEIMEILAEDVKMMRMMDIDGVHEGRVRAGKRSGRDPGDREQGPCASVWHLSATVATTISTALRTQGNSKFKARDGEIDIRLQLKEEDRATLEQLKNTVFERDRGNMVSFASLADFNLRKGPRSLEREDRMSTVKIFANTEQSAVLPVG